MYNSMASTTQVTPFWKNGLLYVYDFKKILLMRRIC